MFEDQIIYVLTTIDDEIECLFSEFNNYPPLGRHEGDETTFIANLSDHLIPFLKSEEYVQ